jgi:hypothetical protein
VPAAFRSLSNTTYASRANTTVTAPAGIQNGDVLLFMLAVGDASPPTPTPPAGFTLLSGFPVTLTDAGFSVATRVWYKIAAGESGDYTATHTTANSQGVVYCAQGGAADTPPVTINSGTGLTSTANGLTAQRANSLIVYLDQCWNTGTTAPPGGTNPTFTERLDNVGLLYVADGVLLSGASGNKTRANANTLGTQPWSAYLLEIANPAQYRADYRQFPKASLRYPQVFQKELINSQLR